jgi:predicted dehydrogenase
MRTHPLKLLIIGCGNMAGGYDLLQPDEALPLGHAKAFIQHGGFDITACIDPNAEQRQNFQSKWKVPQGFDCWQDLPQLAGQFDVISICSPSVFHVNDIQAALSFQPKIIFCEKPVTLSLTQTQQAVTNCARHNVLLAVNYSRRWSPQVTDLKQQLNDGQWGAVRSVSAVYNKGLLNNGSHMLDLCLNLFGPLHITHVGETVFDHFDNDPSIAACLQSAKGVPIQMNLAHAQDYAIFEMQIVTEKGVIAMEDGGASWRFRTAAPSTQLSGYKFLNHGDWMKPQGSYALTAAVANLYDALTQGAPLACSGEHALQAQTLCEQIQQHALTQKPQIQDTREAA